MTGELESLERRISTLEDEELEVMERLEAAQGMLSSVNDRIGAADTRLAELERSRAALVDEARDAKIVVDDLTVPSSPPSRPPRPMRSCAARSARGSSSAPPSPACERSLGQHAGRRRRRGRRRLARQPGSGRLRRAGARRRHRGGPRRGGGGDRGGDQQRRRVRRSHRRSAARARPRAGCADRGPDGLQAGRGADEGRLEGQAPRPAATARRGPRPRSRRHHLHLDPTRRERRCRCPGEPGDGRRTRSR